MSLYLTATLPAAVVNRNSYKFIAVKKAPHYLYGAEFM